MFGHFQPAGPQRANTDIISTLPGSLEDALKSGLGTEWQVDKVAFSNKHQHAISNLKVKLTHLASGKIFEKEYSMVEYAKTEAFARLVSIDIAIFAVVCEYPQLRLIKANTHNNSITIQSDKTPFGEDCKILSNCINAKTGVFKLKIFANLTQFNGSQDSLPEQFPFPIKLSAKQLERGCAAKNIIIADHDPGFGMAVYITGGDSSLGEWQTATRLNHVDGNWRHTLQNDLANPEYKFLFGRFDQGKQVNVADLTYEHNGPNRVSGIIPSTPTLK